MFTSEGKDRKTLASVRYAIQPVWWSDQDESDPKTWISDTEDNVKVMELAKEIYLDMSWQTFEFSWFFLPQKKISVSSENPGYFDSIDYLAQEKVQEEGYVKGVDFDGVVVLYNPSQNGPFNGYGGWASLHGE